MTRTRRAMARAQWTGFAASVVVLGAFALIWTGHLLAGIVFLALVGLALRVSYVQDRRAEEAAFQAEFEKQQSEELAATRQRRLAGGGRP